MDLQAEVVRSHDWAAALLPRLLRESERRHRATLALATVCMIHTIADQGLLPATTFARTDLPDELYRSDGPEDYSQVNYLKGGRRLADGVATVSPRYAREIPHLVASKFAMRSEPSLRAGVLDAGVWRWARRGGANEGRRHGRIVQRRRDGGGKSGGGWGLLG